MPHGQSTATRQLDSWTVTDLGCAAMFRRSGTTTLFRREKVQAYRHHAWAGIVRLNGAVLDTTLIRRLI